MYRGTTPSLTFSLPFDVGLLTAVYITFSQAGAVIFEKTTNDLTMEGDTITCPLTQEDTLLLHAGPNGAYVYIQLRVRFTSGAVAVSEQLAEYVEDVLKDGVI